MLTPLEVYGKKFNKGFRGYEQAEVDSFLEQIAKDFEAIYEENIKLKEDAELVTSKLEQYQQLEKTMQNTLMIAQTTAEEIKSKAQQERYDIINEAQQKAQQTLSVVESNAQSRREELAKGIEEEEKKLAYVQTNIKTCLDSMRGLLENQLKIIGDDNFVKEIANVVVDVELLKKAEPVIEEKTEEVIAIIEETQEVQSEQTDKDDKSES